MSEMVTCGTAVFCYSSCRENTDVQKKSFSLLPRGWIPEVQPDSISKLTHANEEIWTYQQQEVETMHIYRKSTELYRNTQITKYLSSLPKDINILIFPCVYILSQKP